MATTPEFVQIMLNINSITSPFHVIRTRNPREVSVAVATNLLNVRNIHVVCVSADIANQAQAEFMLHAGRRVATNRRNTIKMKDGVTVTFVDVNSPWYENKEEPDTTVFIVDVFNTEAIKIMDEYLRKTTCAAMAAYGYKSTIFVGFDDYPEPVNVLLKITAGSKIEEKTIR